MSPFFRESHNLYSAISIQIPLATKPITKMVSQISALRPNESLNSAATIEAKNDNTSPAGAIHFIFAVRIS